MLCLEVDVVVHTSLLLHNKFIVLMFDRQLSITNQFRFCVCVYVRTNANANANVDANSTVTHIVFVCIA